MKHARPAVFLDRDGTLILDTGYLKDPQSVRVLPMVPQALRMFEAAGYDRIVITNQSGVARGLLTEADVGSVNAALDAMLADAGASVDAFYWCPHLDDGCACRKPLPGLIHSASTDRGIDLSRSVMIGDRGSDVAAGHAAGLPAILVTTGPLVYDGPAPDAVMASLLAAAEWVTARVF